MEAKTRIEVGPTAICILHGDAEILIGWTEISGVSVQRVDCVTHHALLLTLDVEYGEFVEVNATDVGFGGLVNALADRLGLHRSWFDVAASGESAGGVSVWTRG